MVGPQLWPTNTFRDHDRSFFDPSCILNCKSDQKPQKNQSRVAATLAPLRSSCEVWSKTCSKTVLSLAKQPETVEWLKRLRRRIHENPELAFEEFQTSQLIREELDRMEISYRFPWPRPAFELGSAPAVHLSSPSEPTWMPFLFRKQWSGSTRAKWPENACLRARCTFYLLLLEVQGTVILIFQPAEEAGNGAKRMIGDGALEDVEAIFAGCNQWQEGWCVEPHHSVDPVLAASAAVISLQGIVSREANPMDSQVVSVTSFNGGNNLDMIPDTVALGGTFRAFSNITFYQLLQRIEEVIVEQAKVYRCSATVDFFEREYTIYPPTVNNEKMYEHVRKVAIDLVGDNNFRVVPPMMGAEDFSFFSELVPAAFFYIGIRNETLGSIHTGHSPYFMIDEDVLPIGAATHATIAERYLNEHR
ncbi:hypothetical protein FNV43_RR12174 [Rhamnella rubrinervis]|uniref:IAA-amino acid hydrolase ILR1-like 6 n=1 Tax=Rhamnella rubrinervis TaxID=2594499 RepID=A0A8K0H7D9_9ROSA|nr:hypothetical protein FNV43_RR12174 [Rhamnella rubrinervis]